MPPLNRAQSQARTRAALMDTATELFLRDGYFATSLDKVADTAGFSKGAVYSNFRNKDELCLAVIDRIRSDQTAAVADALNAATTEERLAALESWAERTIGDIGWTTLELEFGSQARRDPALRHELARRNREISEVAAAVMAQAESVGITPPPIPAHDLAVAVLAMGVGLGLFRALDPKVPITALTSTLRYLAGLPVK